MRFEMMQRIVGKKDDRVVSVHRLDDSLEENLRLLACNRLSPAPPGKNKSQPDADGLTAEEQPRLRRLLTRVGGGGDAERPDAVRRPYDSSISRSNASMLTAGAVLNVMPSNRDNPTEP